MSMISLRLPDELDAAVTAQAERAGISVDQYVLSIVAQRVGAQVDTERYFAARGERARAEDWRGILAAAGAGQPAEPGDELPDDLAARLGRFGV